MAGGKAVAGCPDGFASAWAARTFLGEGPNVEYIPVAYGLPPPEMLSGSLVYIVDFSFSRDVLLDLAEKHSRTVVLDHHKGAEEALKGLEHPNLAIHFDMKLSGAQLTWDFFSKGKPEPALITFVGKRDLWDFSLPGTAEVHTFLQSFSFDFRVWDDVAEKLGNAEGRASVVEAGASIARFRDQQVAQICAQAELRTIAMHRVPVVNATSFWSEVGHALLDRYPDHPFSVSWFRQSDGKVKLSFRSEKDFDCSAVAKLFKGGGHAQASGATVSWVDWLPLLIA